MHRKDGKGKSSDKMLKRVLKNYLVFQDGLRHESCASASARANQKEKSATLLSVVFTDGYRTFKLGEILRRRVNSRSLVFYIILRQQTFLFQNS